MLLQGLTGGELALAYRASELSLVVGVSQVFLESETVAVGSPTDVAHHFLATLVVDALDVHVEVVLHLEFFAASLARKSVADRVFSDAVLAKGLTTLE